MQKLAFVILPVVALAMLALVLVRTSNRSADGKSDKASARSSADSTLSAEAARLRAEIESLKAENEKQKKRAAAAEEKLAAMSPKTETASTDPKKSSAKSGDWKKRKDGELQAKIDAVDWRKRIKGLIDYWREMEKARLEGRAPRMTPEMIAQLTKLSAEAVDFAKFLGLDASNPYKAFGNELLGRAWMDAFMQEVTGGTLTEDQLTRLRGTDLYKDDDEGLDDPNSNQLETWARLIEHNREYAPATAGILTPEQHALVTSTVTPSFMLSVYAEYMEKSLSGVNATQGVADFWTKSFNLTSDQRQAVEAVAAEYVRRQAEIAQAVAQQYGGQRTREAEYELLLKTIEAQAAAEKKLAESLQLDAEQLKKILRSSGAVIQLAN